MITAKYKQVTNCDELKCQTSVSVIWPSLTSDAPTMWRSSSSEYLFVVQHSKNYQHIQMELNYRKVSNRKQSVFRLVKKCLANTNDRNWPGKKKRKKKKVLSQKYPYLWATCSRRTSLQSLTGVNTEGLSHEHMRGLKHSTAMLRHDRPVEKVSYESPHLTVTVEH